MSDNQPKPASNEKPVRKRSPIERIVVWGGIVTLLAVVALEWSSLSLYDESYKSLLAASLPRDESGKRIKFEVKDIDKHIKGFVFRGDETIETKTAPARGEPVITKRRRLTYQWPSLFRQYKIGAYINGEYVTTVEAIIPGIDP